MKKLLFLTATAALALSACTSDSYLGNPEDIAEEVAISFNSNAAVVTRAAQSHTESAASLDNNFVVYGWKTTGSTEQVVFDHYNVNYVTNTANSTESNSADWEYVNQSRVIKGTSDQILGNLPDGATQEIKYWDFAADKYDFVAFSLGKGVEAVAPATDPTYAEVVPGSAKGVDKTALTSAAYKLTGSAEELAASYIADKVTVLKADYGSQKSVAVQFNFRRLGSKVRIGLFETIPGWSISSVEFYPAVDGSAQSSATLYTKDAAKLLPAGAGTMTVTFPHPTETTDPDYNKAHATFAPTGDTNVPSMNFGALTLATGHEKLENTGLDAADQDKFLARAANTATIADVANDNGYKLVLPNEAGVTNGLNLKVKFTMIALDGSGETIVIDGATATVPQEFTKWQPNYAYTYLFKISDKVSGSTGELLYPITLDAVVVNTEDGLQQTITDFNTPSITTYAKGAVNDEYYKSDNIYVTVDDATELAAGNSKLYTATIEGGAAQSITEAAVANAIANGVAYAVKEVTTGASVNGLYTLVAGAYTACASDAVAVAGTTYYEASTNAKTVVDANGKALTVLPATEALSFPDAIAAEDAPDGNAVTGNFAMFTPACEAQTYYVYEFTKDTKKYYKVIKVAGSTRP